jgi:hypothetical protein
MRGQRKPLDMCFGEHISYLLTGSLMFAIFSLKLWLFLATFRSFSTRGSRGFLL